MVVSMKVFVVLVVMTVCRFGRRRRLRRMGNRDCGGDEVDDSKQDDWAVQRFKGHV